MTTTTTFTRPNPPAGAAAGVLGWFRGLARILGSTRAQALEALLAAVDAKDSYTRSHSLHVAVYADALASRMGLSTGSRRTLRVASLLHDIGKIGVPDSVLNKAGTLSEEEFALVRRHPQIAVDILGPMDRLSRCRDIILHHHERYDGTGYPSRRAGESIPLESRILAVADAVDTMISRRVYKSPMTRTEVRSDLARQAGIQFDPQIAAVAIGWMDDGGLDLSQSQFCDWPQTA